MNEICAILFILYVAFIFTLVLFILFKKRDPELIPIARGKYLTAIGERFVGLKREFGENDNLYRERINAFLKFPRF